MNGIFFVVYVGGGGMWTHTTGEPPQTARVAYVFDPKCGNGVYYNFEPDDVDARKMRLAAFVAQVQGIINI